MKTRGAEMARRSGTAWGRKVRWRRRVVGVPALVVLREANKLLSELRVDVVKLAEPVARCRVVWSRGLHGGVVRRRLEQRSGEAWRLRGGSRAAQLLPL